MKIGKDTTIWWGRETIGNDLDAWVRLRRPRSQRSVTFSRLRFSKTVWKAQYLGPRRVLRVQVDWNPDHTRPLPGARPQS